MLSKVKELADEEMIKFIFYITYFLFFLFGGAIAFIGVPFRMFQLSILIILLVPFYGVFKDRVALVLLIFTYLIIISGIVNSMPMNKILNFLRFVVTPYAMYYIVRLYVNEKNIKQIINLSINIGMIQLPVVLIQTHFYDQLIRYSAVSISKMDFQFGTHYIKGDPALSLFMIGLILFLLFDTDRNYFVHSKYFKATWFTITILMANAIIAHLIIIVIWGIFLTYRINVRNLMPFALIGMILLTSLFPLGYKKKWEELVLPNMLKLTLENRGDEAKFLAGEYSRLAAVRYHVNRPLSILGDGPSRYYDPVSKQYILGNMGQIFTMYSEVGIIGLFLSYLILFSMITSNKRRVSKRTALPFFIAVSILTFTISVLSTASIIFMYCLFSSVGLIQAKSTINNSMQ